MEKVFKFVKGGWLVVIILSLVFALYTVIFTGLNEDVYLALVFAFFGGVMYYLNVRRVNMYKNKSNTPKR